MTRDFGKYESSSGPVVQTSALNCLLRKIELKLLWTADFENKLDLVLYLKDLSAFQSCQKSTCCRITVGGEVAA